MGTIQQILFEDAAMGELLILKTRFVDQIIARVSLGHAKALKAVERAVGYGIIHQTDRNFANSKKIEFISLKIQVLSHQCLQWVITSLRRDEMTPTETAIKNRTKEAFNFKLQNDYWEAIMKSIQAPPQPSARNQRLLSDSSHHSEQKQSVTPPDKGSSAHTTRQQVHRNSGNADSSFTQSSAGSNMPPLTTSTVSAQGITRITLQKQGAVTEADSGSTLRNQKANRNESSGGGAATRSSGQGTDSHGRTEADQPHNNSSSNRDASSSAPQGGLSSANSSDPQQLPRFKVVQQQVAPEEDLESVGGSGLAGSYAIYMEDEDVWTGVDIDDDSTVDRQLYAVMIAFLSDYFCPAEQKPSDSKAAQGK